MRSRQLARFLDAQFDDPVAHWIVIQILVRRLRRRRGVKQGSDIERNPMLLTAVATRRTLAGTDVWN